MVKSRKHARSASLPDDFSSKRPRILEKSSCFSAKSGRNREGMDLLYGLQVSFSKPKDDNQLLIGKT